MSTVCVHRRRSRLSFAVIAAVGILVKPSVGFTAETDTATQLRDADTAVLHDFGMVDTGGIVEHTFAIRNDSTSTISVIDERVSCGCIQILKRPDTISAGESVLFKMALSLEGRYGQVSQKVFVRLKHPKCETLQLKMEGLVRGVWLEPKSIDLGTVNRGETPEREFMIVACGYPDLTITSINKQTSLQLRGIDAVANEAAQKQQCRVLGRYGLKWNLESGSMGVNRNELVAEISDGRRIAIPVTAFVSGASILNPRRLFFGAVKRGRTLTRKGTASIRYEGGAEDLSPESDRQQVVGKVVEIARTAKAETTVTFEVRFSPSDDAVVGTTEGKIDFKHGDEIVFTVPYFGTVLE